MCETLVEGMEDVQVGGIAGEEVPPGVQLGTQRKFRVGKRNVGIRLIEEDRARVRQELVVVVVGRTRCRKLGEPGWKAWEKEGELPGWTGGLGKCGCPGSRGWSRPGSTRRSPSRAAIGFQSFCNSRQEFWSFALRMETKTATTASNTC